MIVAPLSRSVRLAAVIGCVLLSSCSPERSPPPAETATDSAGIAADTARTAADTARTAAPPEDEWVDLVARDDDSESVAPRRFRSSTSNLRVITRMEELASPLAPGRVISNILSDESALPVVTVRAEQLRPDTVTVDTTEVGAGPGELYLFIAEHRGLTDWTVTVQERRAR